MTTSVIHSQTDTVCIPRKDAIRKLAQIENLKADSAELVIRKDELKDLNQLTDAQRTSIKNLTDRNTNQESRIINLNEQTQAAIKELRKVKARAIVFKVAGIGVTTVLASLLIFFR